MEIRNYASIPVSIIQFFEKENIKSGDIFGKYRKYLAENSNHESDYDIASGIACDNYDGWDDEYFMN